MANIITFTFKTEAPYTEDELDSLHGELAEVAKGIDDDIIESSFDTNLIDESHVPDDSEKIEAAAVGMLTNNLQVKMSIDFAKGAIATIDSYSFDA